MDRLLERETPDVLAEINENREAADHAEADLRAWMQINGIVPARWDSARGEWM